MTDGVLNVITKRRLTIHQLNTQSQSVSIRSLVLDSAQTSPLEPATRSDPFRASFAEQKSERSGAAGATVELSLWSGESH